MAELFKAVLNMSITGSIVIAVIILVRFLLKRMPKKYSYVLWSIAGFRLCCPFSLKSVISIFNFNPIKPSTEIVTSSGMMNYIGASALMGENINQTVSNETITNAEGVSTAVTAGGLFDNLIDYIPYLWLCVLVVLLAYALISLIILRISLVNAIKYDDIVYQSGSISSPFILGIIKPKIYIPYDIEAEYFEYVMAHEKHHLKRFDNVIKLFAFVLLAVHWFNPLCWIAFYLMTRDMEMSCDEWVLAHNYDIKKQYSTALLSFAANSRFSSPGALCFGEGSAKSRIKNILKFKKPKPIVGIACIVLCVAVAVVCVLNPMSEDNKNHTNDTDNITVDSFQNATEYTDESGNLNLTNLQFNGLEEEDYEPFYTKAEYTDFNNYSFSGTVKTPNGGIFRRIDTDRKYGGVDGFDSNYTKSIEYECGDVKQIVIQTFYPDLDLLAYVDDELFFCAGDTIYRIKLFFDNDKLVSKSIHYVYYGQYSVVDARENTLILRNGDERLYLNTVTGNACNYDIVNYEPKISEARAIETAERAIIDKTNKPLKQFEKMSCELVSGNVLPAQMNSDGNPLYYVQYFDTESLCDFHRIYIDAEKGECVNYAIFGD